MITLAVIVKTAYAYFPRRCNWMVRMVGNVGDEF